MDKIFMVELPEDESIVDLLRSMARFARADYRMVMMLETGSERLARAMTELTGKFLTPYEPTLDISAAAVGYVEREMAPGRQAPDGQGLDQWMGETDPQANQLPSIRVDEPSDAAVANGKRCEICGAPAIGRATICEKPECKKTREKRWALERKAKRNNDSADQAGQPAEVAATPFAGEPGEKGAVMYSVMSGQLLGQALTFREMRDRIVTGDITEGTSIQAHPSGRYYVVRAGMLEKTAPEPTDLCAEAVPGAETAPMAL